MNEYVKEGKKFLISIENYFKTFEVVTGYNFMSVLRKDVGIPANTPDPVQIIDSLDMFKHTGGEDLILYLRGQKGFDGYCTFLNSDGKVSDPHLRVFVSNMGAWQITLLLVLCEHIMPVYWHACYKEWQPIFTDIDLQNLRNTECRYTHLMGETYDFLPKDLPTEPSVVQIEEGRMYQTIFYVWSDFGGYMKIASTITFPQEIFAVVQDIDIKTEVIKIVPYRAKVML